MVEHAFKFFLVGLALVMASGLFAQGIIAGQEYIPPPGPAGGHNFAIIDSYTKTITMDMNAPFAGEAILAAPNNDMFLRATIYFGGRDEEKTQGIIRASIINGSLPPGTTMTLISAFCTTVNSGGALGNPVTPPITLAVGTHDQDIISNIGTCYTGTGTLDGYQMTFNVTPNSYSQLVSGTYFVTVQFSFHNQKKIMT